MKSINELFLQDNRDGDSLKASSGAFAIAYLIEPTIFVFSFLGDKEVLEKVKPSHAKHYQENPLNRATPKEARH